MDNTTLSYDIGNGASIRRIDKTVYSVGWDGRYVVAKQHPLGDKLITNYFYIDSRLDAESTEPSSIVVGPMSEDEFNAKRAELKLPEFTKTIGALE